MKHLCLCHSKQQGNKADIIDTQGLNNENKQTKDHKNIQESTNVFFHFLQNKTCPGCLCLKCHQATKTNMHNAGNK